MRSQPIPGEEYDLYGEEDMKGFRQLEPRLQCYDYKEICGKHPDPPAVSDTISLMSMRLMGATAEDLYKVITGRKGNGHTCSNFMHNGCQQKLRCCTTLVAPNPPLITLAPQYQESLESSPLILELFGDFYRLFACSLHRIWSLCSCVLRG